jgi:hypothetical protein
LSVLVTAPAPRLAREPRFHGPDVGFVAYVELTAGVSSPAFGVGNGASALVATLVATSGALNQLRALAPGALGRRADATVLSAG